MKKKPDGCDTEYGQKEHAKDQKEQVKDHREHVKIRENKKG